jgi:hypothetical protein
LPQNIVFATKGYAVVVDDLAKTEFERRKVLRTARENSKAVFQYFDRRYPAFNTTCRERRCRWAVAPSI